MARLAQRLPIRCVPEEILVALVGLHVVNDAGERDPTLTLTLRTKRGALEECLAGLLPSPAVASLGGGEANSFSRDVDRRLPRHGVVLGCTAWHQPPSAGTGFPCTCSMASNCASYRSRHRLRPLLTSKTEDGLPARVQLQRFVSAASMGTNVATGTRMTDGAGGLGFGAEAWQDARQKVAARRISRTSVPLQRWAGRVEQLQGSLAGVRPLLVAAAPSGCVLLG